MRSGVSPLVCFVCAVLKLTSPMYIVDDSKKDLSVISTTSSSITLKWDVHQISDSIDLTVTYYSKTHVYLPRVLRWNWNTSHFVATNIYELPHDSGFLGHDAISVELRNKSELIITANYLTYPDTDYEFQLSRTFYDKSRTLINKDTGCKLIARTRPIIPGNPPKTGAGCFHVYKVYESTRLVKVYWQSVKSADNYKLVVYEDGKPLPIFEELGPLDRSWIIISISFKRHCFIFRSKNNAGVSEGFSYVNVPAQEDVLSLPWNSVVWSESKNTTLLTWEKPSNVSVTNFTVFWVDTLDGTATQRIFDFVMLPHYQNHFEVEGTGYMPLGLSINSKTSSSGLQIANRTE